MSDERWDERDVTHAADVIKYVDQLQRVHDLNSLDCWCKPQFFVACDECEGLADSSCWKCSPITFPDGSTVHGLIEVDRDTAALDDVDCIISHRST